MDLKVYALLNAKIKELTGSGGLTQEEVEKIVTDEVAKIVTDAPEDFDTLKEMSDWILSHENSAAEMNSAIQTNANDISVLNTNKVDKVAGKSLISDAEIERLANVDNYNDSSIRADIETNKTNISTLAKHINGDLLDSDFQEDTTAISIKTVPSGISNYAAISKIGGKTVKSRNLINTNETWYKESTSNTVTIKDSTITVTGVWYCAVPVSVKANTVYSISGTIVSGTVNARIAILSKTIGVTTLKLLLNIGYNSGTFNSGSDTTLWIALYGGDLNSGTSVYKDVQLEEGSTATRYMPYGALWNAPVESVVSVGKNILDVNKYPANLIDYYLGANGTITVSGSKMWNTCEKYIPINASGKISKSPNTSIDIAFYDFDKKFISLWSSGNDSSTNIPANAKYIRYDIRKDCINPQIEISDVPTEYSPYFENTLLIPDSDRNLPCFGYGIDESVQNIRDYENGTYTQMVAEVDLGDLNWTVVASYPNSFIASIVEIQMGELDKIGNILCDKYTANAFNKAIYEETDKTIALGTAHNVAITDKSYTDATAFKEAMKGVKLVYELETPVITDCSDMLMPIRVEAGGTITLQNEHSLDVPNTVVYKKEVSLS